MIRWSSRKRRVVHPQPEKWFFPDPRFPQKSPKWGKGNFSSIATKNTILFNRQFKLCPKSVSNHQNQLIEAEKLFKKSHIFVHFHCILLTTGRQPSRFLLGRKKMPLPLRKKKPPLYKGKHQPLTFQLRGCRRRPLLDPMALSHAGIEDQTKQNLSNFNEKTSWVDL